MPFSLAGMRACLTSQHEKLRAVRKPLAQILGLEVFEDGSIDTDVLGTFSGEVPRVDPPRVVVEKKARLGAEKNGVRFGIATEGSFGPHPWIPWVAAHHEWIAWVDRDAGCSVVETVQTTRTNFASLRVQASPDWDSKAWLEREEVRQFLLKAKFPTHGLLMSVPGQNPSGRLRVIKGIHSVANLVASLQALGAGQPERQGEIQIETDMRALANPMRQGMIRRAARKLAHRLAHHCPSCEGPGWGIVRTVAGLECEICALPGYWVRVLVWGCAYCGYEQEQGRTDGRTRAPAAVCDVCNP